MADDMKPKNPLLFNENDPEYQRRLEERDKLKRLAGLQGAFKDILRATTGFESSGDSVKRLDDAGQQIVQDYVDRKNMFQKALAERRAQERFQTQQEHAQQNIEQSEQLFGPKLEQAKLDAEEKQLELTGGNKYAEFLRQSLQSKVNEAAKQQGTDPIAVPQGLPAKAYKNMQDSISSGINPLDIMRLENQKRSLDLRQRELDEYKLGKEERLTDQFTKRMSEKEQEQSAKIIDKFEKDKVVQKANESIGQADNVISLVESDNPIGHAAIPTFMARASGEVGNLSEADKAPFGGSQALLSKIKQVAREYTSGLLTDENKEFVKNLANTMKQAAYKNKLKRGMELGKKYSESYKLPLEQVNKLMMPELNILDQEQLKSLEKSIPKMDDSGKSSTGQPVMVKMRIPDNTGKVTPNSPIKLIPENQVDEAMKRGAKIVRD